MGAFETQLSANLVVAYFIPGIVYLADAVGTQTEALAIRGLSVGVGIRRVVGRETLTGLFVGVLLGGLMFATIVVVWHDPAIAAAVAIAVTAASSITVLVALALPWLLQRLGRDPAFGSGPLATVIQDLLSIVIYLAAVALLVGRTVGCARSSRRTIGLPAIRAISAARRKATSAGNESSPTSARSTIIGPAPRMNWHISSMPLRSSQASARNSPRTVSTVVFPRTSQVKVVSAMPSALSLRRLLARAEGPVVARLCPTGSRITR